MSDAVWLAIIAMVSKGWSDTVSLLTSTTGVTVTGFLIVLVKQWWDGRQLKRSTESVKERIDKVEAVAVRSVVETERQIKGAERQNVELGIKEGIKQASDFGTLRQDYKPESTDVFMARKD